MFEFCERILLYNSLIVRVGVFFNSSKSNFIEIIILRNIVCSIQIIASKYDYQFIKQFITLSKNK